MAPGYSGMQPELHQPIFPALDLVVGTLGHCLMFLCFLNSMVPQAADQFQSMPGNWCGDLGSPPKHPAPQEGNVGNQVGPHNQMANPLPMMNQTLVHCQELN